MSESSIPTGYEYMKGRRQYVLEIQDKIERAELKGKHDKVDSLREELDQLPLSVELVKHVEIMLGVGGPTDWLDVELYEGGIPRSVTYYYTWGSESYRTTLSESDALYRYAVSTAEYVTEAD